MKIYADTPCNSAPEWSWHRSWATGHDSAYGLLMKFAFLNALTARELAQLFVTRQHGIRTRLLRTLQFDMRHSKSFDLEAIAAALRTDLATVQEAFLDQRFKNHEDSHACLRWCEECLAWGLHLSALQIRGVTRCPIHYHKLRDRCRSCEGKISYQFSAELFVKPFCCPHCQAEMGAQLKLARAKLPILKPDAVTLIKRMNRYASTCGTAVKRAVPVPRSVLEATSLLVSGPEPGKADHYIEFIGQVVATLSTTDGQQNLPFARLLAVQCGCRHANSAETTREHLESDGGVDQPFSSEKEMAVAMAVYRALRRHLWTALGTHRACVTLACRHLRWDMRGEETAAFCVPAAVYIRWRMLWEGCGTPNYLQSRRDTICYGILGWLHARPSPYPDDWKNELRAWMLSHVFASVAIESYDAIERSLHNKATVVWDAAVASPLITTHWALSDSKAGRRRTLFLPARRTRETFDATSMQKVAHLAWHAAQLREIAG